MLRFLFLTLCIGLLSSCAQYTQIFETKASQNILERNNLYVYENDTILVTYWFWDERGIVAFNIFNKLDIPLYLDWKKSAFIKDGKKYNYWIDATITNAATYYEDYSVSNSATYIYGEYRSKINLYPSINTVTSRSNSNIDIDKSSESMSIGVSSSNAISVKPERISFIAPKSSILKAEFVISPIYGMKMNKERPFVKMPVSEHKSNKKTKYAKIYYAEYDINKRSPIVFRNFLSYSTSETFERENYVDNTFYVSKILEMRRKYFLGKGAYYNDVFKYEMPFQDARYFYVNIPREYSVEY